MGARSLIRLVPGVGVRLAMTAAVINILLGVFPVLFIVETSVLLGQIPQAGGASFGSPAWDRLVVLLCLTALTLLGQQVLASFQVSVGEILARRVDGGVFDRVMSAGLRSRTVAPLEDEDLLNELSEARQHLEGNYQSPGQGCAGLFALVSRYIQLIGCGIVVGWAFSWLAAVGLLAAVTAFRYGQRNGLRRYAAFLRTALADRRKSRYLRDVATSPAATKEIRIFGLTRWLSGRYREAYLSWMVPTWAARRRIYLRPFFWITAFGLLATASILGALGAASTMESVDLTRLAMVAQATLAAIRLGDHYPEADVQTAFGTETLTAITAFERGGLRCEAAIATPPSGSQAPATPTSAITFENVTFRYPGSDRPIFEGLDLTIPVGHSTALVGANGAGKTTLVKLLARLYEPDAGTICIDGVDIGSLPVDAWRQRLAVIFQDYIRYPASASDNVGFGAPEHLDDRPGIESALQAVGMTEAVAALPKGLQTPLAPDLPDGVDLSGGQWQRVALARVLFAIRHGAAVLILDEPTANLDIRSEARLYNEFVELTQGRTTVLISHRFGTVRKAGNIVVVESGRVLEQGSHADLMLHDGRYAELFRLQASRFAEDSGQEEQP